jgi:hypothetical protein
MNHRSWKPSRYAVALLGTSVIAASTLAAAAPSFAARVIGPPQAHSRLPALRVAPNLSILPVAGRRALAVAKSRELFGVFCSSPSDCWAVGEIKNKTATVNQVLHWTGKKWFTVAVPNQAGTGKGALNELFAVRCTASANCWAVGDSQKSGRAILDQLLHFNGKKWFVVSAPAPGGTAAEDVNTANDVACTSASSCWAVGEYGITDITGSAIVDPEVLFNQTLHWDGKKWTFVKPPNPGGNTMGRANVLDSVRCTAPTDCWAAGTGGSIMNTIKLRNAMLHWNGTKWAMVTVPNPVVKGKAFIDSVSTLACTATANCWAVGVAGKLAAKGFEHNEALHWTGEKWAVVKTPNPDGDFSQLLGVTCTAAGNCWAVGAVGAMSGRNEALHWNSKAWSVVRTPNVGGTGKDVRNDLNSVRCTSASNCWAVGESDLGNGVDLNQLLHWNGISWGKS